MGLRVRVKVVDLDGMAGTSPAERYQAERKASYFENRVDSMTHRWVAESRSDKANTVAEICMHSGARIALQDFERHTEKCEVCANRVELPLDFIETVEDAVFQHHCHPESERIHGALLIGAPELNFAVCGEIELD